MKFQDILASLGPFSWTLHNLIAHPLSEVAHLVGLRRLSNWLHDVTVPTHEETTEAARWTRDNEYLQGEVGPQALGKF